MRGNGNYFEYIAQELRRLPDVARRYTTGRLAKHEKLAIRILLNTFFRLSQVDTGSNELLVYGWLVVARKKNGM
jgi:hypothetical protein